MLACHVRISKYGQISCIELGKMGHTVEGAFVCDIVDEQNAHGTPIVRCGDGSESFLASSIPLEEISVRSTQDDTRSSLLFAA
jgi:hypothetical protein